MTVTDPELAADSMRLVSLMNDVLAAVEATYLNAGVDLPGRRYWLLGTPVVDCEQLTVSFVQAYVGPPGDEASLPQRCDATKTAVLQVQVHRCVPVSSGKGGRPPTAAAMQSAAELLAVDAFLLLDSSNNLEMWDPMGPGLGVIATAEVTEPQGGYQGVLLNLTLAIP